MPKYRCIVATPTDRLFAGDIDYANVPGVEGDFGVLSNHEQFVGMTRPGMLTITVDEAAGEKRKFAVYKGIAQMFNNHLSILVRLGRAFEDIDIADTQAKMDAKKAELDDLVASGEKADDAQAYTREEYIEWCRLQIKLAQGEIA